MSTSIARILMVMVILSGLMTFSQRTAQAAELHQESVANADGLLQKAAQEGSLRVIVGVRNDGLAENDSALVQTEALNQAAQTRLLDTLAEYQLEPYVRFDFIPFLALEVDEAALKALLANPWVTSVEEDIAVPADLASSVPLIGAPLVWNAGYAGAGWAVAVLDTGVQWNHEFFGGSSSSRVISEACYSDGGGGGQSLCQNNTHPADPLVARCQNSGTNMCAHGTHVAGIAAGAGASVSGVAPAANIIAIQVFTRFNRAQDCGGNAPCIASYTTDQILGMQRVLTLSSTYSIAAVNLSLGGGRYYDQATCDSSNAGIRAAIQSLRTAGIVTVSSAGNNAYTDSMGAPGCISEVVGVGATTDADTLANFSNSDEMVDLLAPGVSIYSSVPTNAYATFQGTSMSTAHVSGAWALLKSVNPTATITQILAALQTTGVPVTDSRNGLTRARIQLDAAAASLLPPNIWEGDVSEAWNDSANWSGARIPDQTSNISIPASPVGGRYPVIDVPGATVQNLTIESGATISMSANTFNVHGNWWVLGAGSFQGAGGSVILAGNATHAITQTANISDHFYHLQIGGGADHSRAVLHSDLNVDGNFTIMPGASIAPGGYTLAVAGNWRDIPASFLPDTSTVIFDGEDQVISATRQTLLIDEDFSDFDSAPNGSWYFAGPAGWGVSQDINPATSLPWLFGQTTNAPTPTRGGQVRHFRDSRYTGNFDTWLFTPVLDLHSNGSYRLEFGYGARSASFPEHLVVRYGTGQSSGLMTTDLYQNLSIVNTTWNTAVIMFTVPADGRYSIGFRAYGTEAGTYDIALDDVKLTQSVDTTFYNLTVASNSVGASLGSGALVRNQLLVNPNATFNLDGYPLTVDGTLTNNGTLIQRKDVPAGATSEFLHIQNTAGTLDQYHGVDITPNNTGMGMTTVAIRGNQASGCTSNPSDAMLHRCFEVTPASAQTATLRLWYSEAERNNQPANSLALWHYNGPGSWSLAGDGYTRSETGASCASGGSAACWMQANNITAYSPFNLGNGGAPTAIQLVHFSANQSQAGMPAGIWVGLLVFSLVGLVMIRNRKPG